MIKKIFWITLVLYVSASSIYRYTDLFKHDVDKTTIATKIEVKTEDVLKSLKMKAIKLKDESPKIIKDMFKGDENLKFEDLSDDDIDNIYKYVDNYINENCDTENDLPLFRHEITDIKQRCHLLDDIEKIKIILNDLDEIVPGFKNIVLNTKLSKHYTELFGTYYTLSLARKLKLNLELVVNHVDDNDTWIKRLLINITILSIPFILLLKYNAEDEIMKEIIYDSFIYTLLISTVISTIFNHSVYGIFDLSRWYFDLGFVTFFIVKFRYPKFFESLAIIFGVIVVAGQVLDKD